VSLCAYCGYAIVGSSGICPFHSDAEADDWARQNRIMCDFIHRGVVMAVPDDGVMREAA
jgi:hypothetical protein